MYHHEHQHIPPLVTTIRNGLAFWGGSGVTSTRHILHIVQLYNYILHACCVNDISESARMLSCDTSIEKWCCSLNSCTTVLSIVNFQRQRLYFLSKFRGHYNRPRQHYFVVASVSNINLCAMVKENPMRYQCKSVLVCKLEFNSLSHDLCVLPNNGVQSWLD